MSAFRMAQLIGVIGLSVMMGCGRAVQTRTAIGAGPTITIDVRQILADVRGPVRVHLCVSATCNSMSKRDGRQLDAVFLDDPSIHDSGPVLVGLSIESRSGEVIYARKANVELSRMEPNGPNCPPTFYSTALVATARAAVSALVGKLTERNTATSSRVRVFRPTPSSGSTTVRGH
jgi:hypothetical protein